MHRHRRVTSPVLRKCQSVTTTRPCGARLAVLSATAYSATRWPVPLAYPSGPGGDHVQMRHAPLRLRLTVTGQSGRCTQLPVSLRIVLDAALTGSAVAPGTLPTGRRFARTAGSPTPLLSSAPWSVASVSWQGAGAPCQATTTRLACASCWSATRGSCGLRPLRPPASLLHNAALPSVPGSHSAKAPFGVGHRCTPFG